MTIEKNEDSPMHQLHITIPLSLYEELKKILPEYGQITSTTRNLLIRYVAKYNSKSEASPSDSAIEYFVEKKKRTEMAEGD